MEKLKGRFLVTWCVYVYDYALCFEQGLIVCLSKHDKMNSLVITAWSELYPGNKPTREISSLPPEYVQRHTDTIRRLDNTNNSIAITSQSEPAIASTNKTPNPPAHKVSSVKNSVLGFGYSQYCTPDTLATSGQGLSLPPYP